MPDRFLMMTECDPGVMADRKSGAAPDVCAFADGEFLYVRLGNKSMIVPFYIIISEFFIFLCIGKV